MQRFCLTLQLYADPARIAEYSSAYQIADPSSDACKRWVRMDKIFGLQEPA